MAKKAKSSKSLPDAARKAMHAVVQIHAQGFCHEDVRSILDPRYTVPLGWTGSGFFIKLHGKEGYVVTNSHVVRNANFLQMMSLLTSEEMFTLELVGLVKSQEPDVALLRLPPEELKRFKKIARGKVPFLNLTDSEQVTRGVDLKAIGYPLGMAEPNISGGEVSNFVSGDEVSLERIVTDAAINPGNSGGPAIIAGGKVIGINTAIISQANNIGFITPSNFARILSENFVKIRRVELADFGGRFQKNSDENARYLKQSNATGVIVTKVLPGGMLDRAGLTRLDILLGVNKLRFDRHGIVIAKGSSRKKNIFDVIRQCPVGKEVTLHFVRWGKTHQVVVSAEPRPNLGIQSQPIVCEREYIEFGGMIIQSLTHEIISSVNEHYGFNYTHLFDPMKISQPKVIITYIDDGSYAENVTLDPGEIITKVQGKKITNLKSFQSVVRKAIRSGEKYVLIETDNGSFGAFEIQPGMEEKQSLMLKKCGRTKNV